MEALILAGGLGTRLRSKVSDRPKVMAEISGRPFLDYLFDQIITAGISKLILSTGYMSDVIREYYDHSYKTLTLHYSEEPEQLGTGGALKYATPHLTSDYVLVMNGDSYCDVNLKLFIESFYSSATQVGMVLNYQSDTSRFGRVEMEGSNVVQFNEKTGEVIAGWINAGIYCLKKTHIESISNGNVSLENDLFPKWVSTGIFGFISEDQFIDIGTPETYTQAETFFSRLERA